MRSRVGASFAAALALVGACVPRARPLPGAPAPTTVRLRAVDLPRQPERVVFRWRYAEPGFSARGDGVARTVGPDSARLDFFLEGGFGSGWALLVGNELRTPDDNVARRLVPAPPLLWAALGRLATNPTRDTTLRVRGDTVRAELGSGSASTWRVALVGGGLLELERLVGGRVTERVSRAGSAVRYQDVPGRRSLTIDVTRREPAAPFAPSIWNR